MCRLTLMLISVFIINAGVSAGDTVFVQIPQGYDNYMPSGYFQAGGLPTSGDDMLFMPDGGLIGAFIIHDISADSTTLTLAKYLPYEPVFDPSFGASGILSGIFDMNTMSYPWANVRSAAMEMDSAGRILIAGVKNGQLFLTRISAGQVDTTFGNNSVLLHPFGFTVESITDVLVDKANGDAVYVIGIVSAGGNQDGVIFKLNMDGVLNPGFGTGGAFRVDYNANDSLSAGAMSANSIMVVGNIGVDSLMASIDKSTGTYDAAFNAGAPKVTDYSGGLADYLADVVYTPDGDFVASGKASMRFFAVSVEPDGTPDAGFGMGGRRDFAAPFYHEDKPFDSEVYAMDQDAAGNLWITGLIEVELHDAPVPPISHLSVWLLQPDGTSKLDTHHGAYFRYNDYALDYSHISAIGVLPNGGFAIFGTTTSIQYEAGARIYVTGLLPNLLVNSGFEERTGKTPTGWNVTNPTSLKVQCGDPMVVRVADGACSIKFKGGAPVPAVIVQKRSGTMLEPLALEGQEINLNLFIMKFNSFRVDLRVRYADGTAERRKFRIAPEASETYIGIGTLPMISAAADDVVEIKLKIKGAGVQQTFVFDGLVLTANQPNAMIPFARNLVSSAALPVPPAPPPLN